MILTPYSSPQPQSSVGGRSCPRTTNSSSHRLPLRQRRYRHALIATRSLPRRDHEGKVLVLHAITTTTTSTTTTTTTLPTLPLPLPPPLPPPPPQLQHQQQQHATTTTKSNTFHSYSGKHLLVIRTTTRRCISRPKKGMKRLHLCYWSMGRP